MDIKAEFLAYLLADDLQLETEQVLFFSKNYHQRLGSKDVLGVTDGWSEKMQKKLTLLEVCREGMFDTLPEGVFLSAEFENRDTIYQAKTLSEQEVAARKLLLPFEQLFYWLLFDNAKHEVSFESNLTKYWERLFDCSNPFLEAFSEQDKEILLQLLPVLPEVVGNWPLTAQWLSFFLERQVEIKEIPPPTYPISKEMQKPLGEGVLGGDVLLGVTFLDWIPGVEIKLSIDKGAVTEYLPEGKQRRLLEDYLLPMLLPIETPYQFNLSTELEQVIFKLGQSSYISEVEFSKAQSTSSDVLGFARLGLENEASLVQMDEMVF
jgi:type VI secretion system protein ImpH